MYEIATIGGLPDTTNPTWWMDPSWIDPRIPNLVAPPNVPPQPSPRPLDWGTLGLVAGAGLVVGAALVLLAGRR